MDAWSIAAILGLIFAGNKINSVEDPTRTARKEAPIVTENEKTPYDQRDQRILGPGTGKPFDSTTSFKPKREVGSFQDVSPNAQFPFGQPVYNLYNRQTITNKMNNLNPGGSPMQVGSGLGVCADVPAAGGFQQFFRVLPNNPNDERLIPLEGNMGGPTNPIVKNGLTVIGEITQLPEKNTIYRTGGLSGQGQGGELKGPEGRPEFTKTERPTIRAETGNSQFSGPSQYNVYQPYVDTGIKSLPRITNNRSNPDRPGNAGGMNVRGDPLSVIGAVSYLRREIPTDHPGIPDPGKRFSRYIKPEYTDVNVLKETLNPNIKALSIGKDVTRNNPLQININ